MLIRTGEQGHNRHVIDLKGNLSSFSPLTMLFAVGYT